jgi:hypothetical protein
MQVAVTSLLRDKLPPFKRVFHYVFLHSLHITFINRNHVLLYLCSYGCIYDIFLFYYWIYTISLCNLFIISSLSFCAKNNPYQWYHSRLFLIVFFCACPRRGTSISSWVLSLSLLKTIVLTHPRNPQWWKKIKTTEQTILSVCCFSKPSRDRGMK